MGADILFILRIPHNLAVICDGNDRDAGNNRRIMLLITRCVVRLPEQQMLRFLTVPQRVIFSIK